MDASDAYRGIRERVTDLVQGLGPDVAEQRAPACPQWTIRMVVAHLTGVCSDVLAGNLEGAGTDPWTNHQVSARADASLADLLAEWNEAGPQIEAALGEHMPDQLLFDTATHEHDLRSALDRPGARDGLAIELGLNFALMAIGTSFAGGSLPAVTVRSDGGQERPIGDGPPVTVLDASSFDLMRSFSGRRTRDQIASLDWGGADPAPWLDAFTYGPFTLPTHPFE